MSSQTRVFSILAVFIIFCICQLESACPIGFDQINSKCLSITSQRYTHHKAGLVCAEKNAHLVFIQTAIDNNALLNYASNITSPMWIGATCKVNKQPKQCTWDGGSLIDYNNFLPGYPVTNIGTCVYFDSPNQPLKGKWISATCELDEYHAICEAS